MMNMTIEARPGGHLGPPGAAACLKSANRIVAHRWCPRKSRSVRPAVPSRHGRTQRRPLLSSPPRRPASHLSSGPRPSSSGPFPSSFSSPLSNPTRCFFPSAWEEEQDDSSYLNAICYPDIVLEEDAVDDYGAQPDDPPPPFAGAPSSMWPRGIQSVDAVTRPTGDSAPVPEVLPRPYDPLAPPPIELLGEGGDPLALSPEQTKSMWRNGAAAAVYRAEEDYRRAWKELQEAEKRLQSTRQVAAELELLTPKIELTASPVEDSMSFSASAASDLSGPRLTHSNSNKQGEADSTAGSDSDGEVWYIEACAEDWEGPTGAGSSDPQMEGELEPATFADARDAADDAVVAAEGAMSCSKVALDKAATELIRRLKEETELQVQVMNRNIEALDQGGQYQVAHWLVDQMDASAAAQGGEPCDAEGGCEGMDTWSLAVPLNLDLAMRGYDQHAVRFLRHLPYGQVLKIKAIPPTQETMSFAADAAAAEAVERLATKPPPAAAAPAPLLSRPLPALPAPEQRASLPLPALATGFREEELRLFDPLEIEKDIEEHFFLGPGFRGGDALPVLSPSDSLKGKERRKGKGSYQARLVLLGGAVCSLAAYMVANFELMVLAKDVSVILCAMSLAFLAAKFVWRYGDHAEETGESGVASRRSPEGRMARRTRADRKKRSPSWDQVIWLIGGLAVVLSLSTMIALACKAAHSGLTAVTSLACSFVLQLLPSGAGLSSAALASASHTSAQALVRHVSMSLWLVLGGGILSSGVETLGSAAAWAMLLLCVAFSIVSAPFCIASATSRRVGALFALARKHAVS